MVEPAVCLFQTFLPALSRINLHLSGAQQFARHHQIHFIIVHNQHFRFGSFKTLFVFFPLIQLALYHEIHGSHRHGIHHLLFHGDSERGAFRIDAVHGNLTAHHFDELFGNGKPQSRPFDFAVSLLVHPPERGKQVFQTFFLNTDSGIRHGDFQ